MTCIKNKWRRRQLKLNRTIAYGGYGLILALSFLNVARTMIIMLIDFDLASIFNFAMAFVMSLTLFLFGCITQDYLEYHCIDLLK